MCMLHHVAVPNLTFDQLLYIKAVDITMKVNLNIVIRLGGFHTLMSFLGAIGHLMIGSGLKDILCLLYGPNAVDHVLSGKAYDRAIKGHFVVHAALSSLLLDFITSPLPDDNKHIACSIIITLTIIEFFLIL